MALKDLQKELKTMDKEALIEMLSDLYKKYKPVKEYLDFFVELDQTKLLTAHKEIIDKAFERRRKNRIKVGKAKEALRNFKKLDTSPECYGELLMYYLEKKITHFARFKVYQSITSSDFLPTFRTALSLFDEAGMLEKYREQAQRVSNIYPARSYSEGISDLITLEYQKFYGIKP